MTDSYGGNAEADTYHSERGNTDWDSYTEDQKTAARLRASEYIDGTYRLWFDGYKTDGRSQDREWPRTDAYVWSQDVWVAFAADEVPLEILQATYEAALYEAAETGYLTPVNVPSSNKKSVSVSGAVSVEYWSDDVQPVVTRIGMLLAPLFENSQQASNPLSGKTMIG